ncbi:unnamed protein product, partial [marine sediment metagenome]
QNEFFNIKVNVSCSVANCGNINITFDPATQDTILADVNSPQTLVSTPSPWVNATVKNQTWLEFDQLSDYVKVPQTTNLVPSSDVTVCTQFKKSEDEWYYILDSRNTTQNGWFMGLSTSSRVQFGISNATGVPVEVKTTVSGFTLDTWYHFCGRYDGAKIYNFINGSEIGSATKAGVTIVNHPSNITIGALSTLGNALNGTLDNIRIYNKSLTNQNIFNIDKGLYKSVEVPIILYHRLNDTGPAVELPLTQIV